MRPCWEHFVQMRRAQDVDYALFKRGEGENNSIPKLIQENSDIRCEKEAKVNKSIMARWPSSI